MRPLAVVANPSRDIHLPRLCRRDFHLGHIGDRQQFSQERRGLFDHRSEQRPEEVRVDAAKAGQAAARFEYQLLEGVFEANQIRRFHQLQDAGRGAIDVLLAAGKHDLHRVGGKDRLLKRILGKRDGRIAERRKVGQRRIEHLEQVEEPVSTEAEVAELRLDFALKGAVAASGRVEEVFLKPQPCEGAKLIQEVPHAAVAAASKKAEGAAAGLAHVQRGLHVGSSGLRFDSEGAEFLVHVLGEFAAQHGNSPQGRLDGGDAVAGVLLKRAGDGRELVAPHLRDAPNPFVQRLAQPAAANRDVLFVGRPDADEFARLIPGVAGPASSIRSARSRLDLPFQAVQPAFDLFPRRAFRPARHLVLDVLLHRFGLEPRIAHHLRHEPIDRGGILRRCVLVPLANQIDADLLCGGAQEQPAGEPDAVGSEPAERAAPEIGRLLTKLFESRAERRREIVSHIGREVRHAIAERFGRAIRHRHEVRRRKRQALSFHLRSFRPAVLGHEVHVLFGIVIEFGERRVQVGEFAIGSAGVRGRGRVDERRDRRVGGVHPPQHAPHGEAQVDEHPARAARRTRKHVHLRHVVARQQPRLIRRLLNGLGMRGHLKFATQARHEAEVVVAEGEAAECPRAAGLEVPRNRVELLAGQPVEDLFELPTAIARDRLERHREDIVGREGHIGRSRGGFVNRVRIAIDVEEADGGYLGNIAEPIDEPTPNLLKCPPTEAADADEDGRPQDPDFFLDRGHAEEVVFLEIEFDERGGTATAAGLEYRDPSAIEVARRREIDIVNGMRWPRPGRGFQYPTGAAAARIARPRPPLKRANEQRATREAFVRIFGQRLRQNRSIHFREHREVGLLGHVLERELPNVLPAERPQTREQFDVDDREAVLIRVLADLVGEGFRRGVDRGHAAEQSGTGRAFELLDEAEVRDLHEIGHDEQVSRLHIEVLEVVLLDEVIEADSRVVQEAEEHVARNAGAAELLILGEGVVEVLVGQLHHDDEFAPDILDALDGEDEGMANLLDAFERLHLLLGAEVVAFEGVEVAVDEFDGFLDAAGRDAAPNLAEPTGSDRFDEAVARDRFAVGLAKPVHSRSQPLVRRQRVWTSPKPLRTDSFGYEMNG